MATPWAPDREDSHARLCPRTKACQLRMLVLPPDQGTPPCWYMRPRWATCGHERAFATPWSTAVPGDPAWDGLRSLRRQLATFLPERIRTPIRRRSKRATAIHGAREPFIAALASSISTSGLRIMRHLRQNRKSPHLVWGFPVLPQMAH